LQGNCAFLGTLGEYDAMTLADIEANLLPATRFRALSRRRTGIALAVLALLVAVGLMGGMTHDRAMAGPGDVALYARIVADVADGQPYYAAVTREHRFGVHRYPLRPVFAVRTPLLAVGLAALPGVPARILAMRLLTVLVLLAWGWRLDRDFARPPGGSRAAGPLFAAFGVLALLMGTLPGLIEQGYAMHEVWAGELIALALALYDPRRWWPSVAIGLMAACLRELAAPFLLAMAAAAWFEGRRRETAAWGGAMVVFAGFMLLHAQLLAPYLRPDDPASPSWLGFGGWPFVLLNAQWNVLLVSAPVWLVALVVPLMLFGAVAWPGGRGGRLALICSGYCLAFMVVGRSVNAYWGLVISPLLALALALAPFGVFDACRRFGLGTGQR
jgi:hypothetical protein